MHKSGLSSRGIGAHRFFKPRLGQLSGSSKINEWSRVIGADSASVLSLVSPAHAMRLMDKVGGNASQFRNPPANELTLRVMVDRLFHRVIYPEPVDSRRAGLHLNLAEVNTGFKVEKVPGKMDGRSTPMQPERVAGDAHKHGSHAEIEPASRPERAHTSIDHGPSGMTGGPRLKKLVSEVVFAQPIQRSIQILVLQSRLIFELLHEVASPPKATLESLEVLDEALLGWRLPGWAGQ